MSVDLLDVAEMAEVEGAEGVRWALVYRPGAEYEVTADDVRTWCGLVVTARAWSKLSAYGVVRADGEGVLAGKLCRAIVGQVIDRLYLTASGLGTSTAVFAATAERVLRVGEGFQYWTSSTQRRPTMLEALDALVTEVDRLPQPNGPRREFAAPRRVGSAGEEAGEEREEGPAEEDVAKEEESEGAAATAGEELTAAVEEGLLRWWTHGKIIGPGGRVKYAVAIGTRPAGRPQFYGDTPEEAARLAVDYVEQLRRRDQKRGERVEEEGKRPLAGEEIAEGDPVAVSVVDGNVYRAGFDPGHAVGEPTPLQRGVERIGKAVKEFASWLREHEAEVRELIEGMEDLAAMEAMAGAPWFTLPAAEEVRRILQGAKQEAQPAAGQEEPAVVPVEEMTGEQVFAELQGLGYRRYQACGRGSLAWVRDGVAIMQDGGDFALDNGGERYHRFDRWALRRAREGEEIERAQM